MISGNSRVVRPSLATSGTFGGGDSGARVYATISLLGENPTWHSVALGMTGNVASQALWISESKCISIYMLTHSVELHTHTGLIPSPHFNFASLLCKSNPRAFIFTPSPVSSHQTFPVKCKHFSASFVHQEISEIYFNHTIYVNDMQCTYTSCLKQMSPQNQEWTIEKQNCWQKYEMKWGALTLSFRIKMMDQGSKESLPSLNNILGSTYSDIHTSLHYFSTPVHLDECLHKWLLSSFFVLNHNRDSTA